MVSSPRLAVAKARREMVIVHVLRSVLHRMERRGRYDDERRADTATRAFFDKRPRTTPPGSFSCGVGRSPDWRVLACAVGLPGRASQWRIRERLAAYSCGGSSDSRS